jgi:hypothetical protein
MSIKPPPGMAECPLCDNGFTGVEEDSGRPYSCYACGESGWMPTEAVTEYWRERAWQTYLAAEASIRERARLGVPPGWRYWFNDGEICMAPPRGVKPPSPAPVGADEWDDIPF